ncbi:MAG: Ribosome small subunit biogenesis RbfA-release protein RsgA [Firmicutes bacterium]|nr:Ribosome small subunit biogenesis RbfA-release protein RsgA [Bacillota bacterium]MDI6705480.1 ribosome small subunit-dependent GTPase A [Bacillota bacterium]
MLQGRVVKGIGGFYYVRTELGLIECKPRGIFRKEKISPLVGDRVKISLIKSTGEQGVIEEILPRENVLIRPSVANVDHCVIVMSLDNPKPDLLLLDRLLVMAGVSNLNSIICINKMDLESSGCSTEFAETYVSAGYRVVRTSTKTGQGLDDLKDALKDRTSVFAGLSGVGKSSLLNSIQPQLQLRTGEISDRLKRGRHTTRHAELLELSFGGMVVDTPGFSSLKLSALKYEDIVNMDLAAYFPEFKVYSGRCRFAGCRHLKEPGCSVKSAVEKGRIASWRYENYTEIMGEIEESRRRRYD